MPKLGPDLLLRRLAGGDRGGAYFLFGGEEFLKEEAAARIIDAHLDPATRDFNLDQLRGAETSPETLASMLQTPPLMGEWRVVVVRDIQAMAGSARAREVVESVLDRPVPGLALVLLGQIPAGSKARFYDALQRQALAAEFAPLAESDVPGWLVGRGSAEGIDLDPQAAAALAAAVGTDLGVLINELAKLTDYVGDRRAIRRPDVEAAVGHVPRQNRWEWFDMVGETRFADARRALPVLLAAGEVGAGLVVGLGTHLLRIGVGLAGGSRALESELPPHQRWLVRRLAAQAKRWTPHTLDAALDDLLRADRLLKSTSLDDRQILDEWLFRAGERSNGDARR